MIVFNYLKSTEFICPFDCDNTTMAKTSELKALFFDVFGTCVDWRKTVTEALIDAAKQAGDTKMVFYHEHNTHKRRC